ncbi:peptidoglycan DD-metalloendopeptidase family protein [Herbaspirillum hiltneri]|uniref:peptidoglycan DD-metalloendopeptidase family protein n=1 Tax=Herbaspirillum hiltneri TaxID=341045 RepID=UPI002E151BE1
MLRYISIVVVVALAACASTPYQGDSYTVRKGDTLMSISRTVGKDHHDIAAWNKLSDANEIYPGDVLRLKPPATVAAAPVSRAKPAAATTAARESKAESRKAPESATPAASAAEAERLDWMWPAQGKLTATTDRNLKGIDIAGTPGQPVWAAESGKVTYAGRGIRGYGNMIIVKHSRTLLSVYAHNKSIMVKEGQSVNRGQQIAEMGDTDSRTVKLYFEIRSNGKPLNPVPLLPKPRS